jgi:hypothetical protein
MIGKKQVYGSLEGKKYTYEQTRTILQGGPDIEQPPSSSLPIGCKGTLGPEDIMLGKAGTGVLSVS